VTSIQPFIKDISREEGSVRLKWTSILGQSYQVEASISPGEPWQAISPPLMADGIETSWKFPALPSSSSLLRIRKL
jgi:hypothetical protein